MRSMYLVLVVMRKLLESQENYLNPENRLSQEKNCQKERIYPILVLEKPDQNF